MIAKIYLDMDGVLCDFEKRYTQLYDEYPQAKRERKLFSENWHDFVKTGQFEKLDYFPGAKDLMRYVDSLKIPVEILSSSGGELYHKVVERQKKNWLSRHGITYKANIVTGRKEKAAYAKSNIILIDDTEQVIQFFNEAGGIGILHKSFGKTKEIIEKHLKDD